MSNNESLTLNVTQTKPNLSKFATVIFKAQQVDFDEQYAFYKAVYDNIKKSKVRSTRLAMIVEFMEVGKVPVAGKSPVKFLPSVSKYWDADQMLLEEMTVDGKLKAPMKSNYKSVRPSGKTRFSFSCTGEQSLDIDVDKGTLSYDINENNHNVRDAKDTWMYKAVYGFINAHTFGRTETGVQRYASEYQDDGSYEYYGADAIRYLKRQDALFDERGKRRSR